METILLAAQDRCQHHGLLLGRSQPGHLLNRAEVEHLRTVSRGGGAAGERLHHEHGVEQRGALPAVRLGQRDPGEALVRQQPEYVQRQASLVAGEAEGLSGPSASRCIVETICRCSSVS